MIFDFTLPIFEFRFKRSEKIIFIFERGFLKLIVSNYEKIGKIKCYRKFGLASQRYFLSQYDKITRQSY